MRDTELYRYLLGLETPWMVSRVKLSLKEQRVDVWAEHEAGRRWPCPECGRELVLRDHSDERAWRHANVLTYFAHRITNAVAEGLNSKIQTIKQMACGFRNRENFKTAIYFHCGGLQLYPATHGDPG